MRRPHWLLIAALLALSTTVQATTQNVQALVRHGSWELVREETAISDTSRRGSECVLTFHEDQTLELHYELFGQTVHRTGQWGIDDGRLVLLLPQMKQPVAYRVHTADGVMVLEDADYRLTFRAAIP